MKNIWLISKAWTDSLENNSSDAFGYAVIGFVDSEEKAIEIVRNGGPADKCWANTGKEPMFKFQKISELLI